MSMVATALQGPVLTHDHVRLYYLLNSDGRVLDALKLNSGAWPGQPTVVGVDTPTGYERYLSYAHSDTSAIREAFNNAPEWFVSQGLELK